MARRTAWRSRRRSTAVSPLRGGVRLLLCSLVLATLLLCPPLPRGVFACDAIQAEPTSPLAAHIPAPPSTSSHRTGTWDDWHGESEGPAARHGASLLLLLLPGQEGLGQEETSDGGKTDDTQKRTAEAAAAPTEGSSAAAAAAVSVPAEPSTAHCFCPSDDWDDDLQPRTDAWAAEDERGEGLSGVGETGHSSDTSVVTHGAGDHSGLAASVLRLPSESGARDVRTAVKADSSRGIDSTLGLRWGRSDERRSDGLNAGGVREGADEVAATAVCDGMHACKGGSEGAAGLVLPSSQLARRPSVEPSSESEEGRDDGSSELGPGRANDFGVSEDHISATRQQQGEEPRWQQTAKSRQQQQHDGSFLQESAQLLLLPHASSQRDPTYDPGLSDGSTHESKARFALIDGVTSASRPTYSILTTALSSDPHLNGNGIRKRVRHEQRRLLALYARRMSGPGRWVGPIPDVPNGGSWVFAPLRSPLHVRSLAQIPHSFPLFDAAAACHLSLVVTDADSFRRWLPDSSGGGAPPTSVDQSGFGGGGGGLVGNTVAANATSAATLAENERPRTSVPPGLPAPLAPPAPPALPPTPQPPPAQAVARRRSDDAPLVVLSMSSFSTGAGAGPMA
ncbi:hypothetical protein CLOM_g7106, partial [Closterium sp. NIES-68]